MIPIPNGSARSSRARASKRAASVSAVAVFARVPAPEKVKTRLIPLLGAAGAAGLHAALLQDTLHKVSPFRASAARYLYLQGSRHFLAPAGYKIAPQRGADLGARLGHAFEQLLKRHVSAIVIGTDSPLLPVRALGTALGELRVCDAVLGPCPDGGYYLLGLRRYEGGLLRGIRWGTRFAFRDTLRNLLRRQYCCSILEPCPDVDRPHDVLNLRERLSRDAAARRLAPATWRFLRAWTGTNLTPDQKYCTAVSSARG
ncbi:MAG: TIGR04282 family arsenosugar biosynthesis glycosyltransferase [Acidobacteriia bacterium]|nr:TIGR04282 family arsenosugar biosynthesis glycosyltransferase [Terriglobia bacterium]